ELIPSAGPGSSPAVNANTDDVIALLRRHACTVGQVASAFGVPTPAAQELIDQLLCSGNITKRRMKKNVYYDTR
ncbi:MAG: winged helix-turn-helix domain-containing protein, partial [bacterium]